MKPVSVFTFAIAALPVFPFSLFLSETMERSLTATAPLEKRSIVSDILAVRIFLESLPISYCSYVSSCAPSHEQVFAKLWAIFTSQPRRLACLVVYNDGILTMCLWV